MRQSAVGALGQIGDAAAVPGLIDALRDENSGVRLEAAEILKEFNTPEAREALKGS